MDGDSVIMDRPVVPGQVYKGGVANAPSTMTWKHLLLGAVHNTPTGGHRKAADMMQELSQLVAWWPPEALRKDCQAWVARCKLYTSVHR